MKFLCIACVLGALVVPSVALDREAFTFTNYDLTVRIEPEQQRLGARGKLTLRNDSPTPQKDIALQISSTLDWKSIQAAGKPVQFVTHEYTSDIDHTGALSEAIVTLPHEVPPKGAIELTIGYEGIVPLNVTRLTRVGLPEDKARHIDWDQISKSFTAVRGIGYVVWYPVAAESANLSEGNSVAETEARWNARFANTTMSLMFESTIDAFDSKNWLLPCLNLKLKLKNRHAVFISGSCFGSCAPKAIPEGACENVSLSLLKVFTTRKMSSAEP